MAASTKKVVAPKAGQAGFIGPVKPAVEVYQVSNSTPQSNPSNYNVTGGNTAAIKSLQTSLNANGANLKVDGILGPLTSAAQTKYSGSTSGAFQGPMINTKTGASTYVAPNNSNISANGTALVNNQSFRGTSSSSGQSQSSNFGGTQTNNPSSTVVNALNMGTDAINSSLTISEQKIIDRSQDIPTAITVDPIQVEREKIAAEEKKSREDFQTGLLKEFNNKEARHEIDAKLRRELGIQQKQQLVSDLTGQLNGIVAQGQANQLAQVGQGRGIPEAIIGGIQAQIGRETAIAALPVQAQLSAAQGNLEMANDSLDRLFKIYSEEAQNEYEFRTEQRKMVYEFATAEQKKKLEVLDKQDARKLQEQDAMLADGKSYAKMAFANGQSALGAKIMALNPKSPTYQQELVQLISQVKDPNMTLDLAIKNQQLANLQKTNSLMGEPTAKEKKEEALALQSSQGQTDVLKEKVALIDSILGNNGFFGGLRDSVGPNPFSRGTQGAFNSWTGVNQQFAGGVHKLASKEFLDTLIAAKQSGATFGSLTDREGDALRASATQLNDWEIKNDKGLGTGVWNIDEQSFIKELNNLKRLANQGIQNAQGTVLDQEEASTLDNIFSPDNMALDPSNYY